jgi:hypothetical protein
MWERLKLLREELLDTLLSRRLPKKKAEELALEILEYGRMNAPSPGEFIVEVPDIAHRLRERPRNVRQSLHLLETKGIAHKTASKDYWKLTA